MDTLKLWHWNMIKCPPSPPNPLWCGSWWKYMLHIYTWPICFTELAVDSHFLFEPMSSTKEIRLTSRNFSCRCVDVCACVCVWHYWVPYSPTPSQHPSTCWNLLCVHDDAAACLWELHSWTSALLGQLIGYKSGSSRQTYTICMDVQVAACYIPLLHNIWMHWSKPWISISKYWRCSWGFILPRGSDIWRDCMPSIHS